MGFAGLFDDDATATTADASLDVSGVVVLARGARLGGASGMLASSDFGFDLRGGRFVAFCCKLLGLDSSA